MKKFEVMKRGKQVRQNTISRNESTKSNVCVYSTSTYYSLDSMLKAKKKEPEICLQNEELPIRPKKKMSRKKLIDKLKRKGLSKSTIKSQLRPRLTWNMDFEDDSKEDSKRENSKNVTQCIPTRFEKNDEQCRDKCVDCGCSSSGKKRLNKVMQELNIGYTRAVQYIRSEFGVQIQSINSTITDEQYDKMRNDFIKDRVIRSTVIVNKGKRMRIKGNNTNPKSLVYTGEERRILNELKEEEASSKSLATIIKSPYPRKRTKNRSEISWLTNYKYPYIRFVNIPFGGGRKR